MSAPPVLAADALTVARGPRTVLHDVTFEIQPGERVAIVGPNGAGKTTLLLTLLGILAPQDGTVQLNGVDLRRIRPRRRVAMHMAYVPQHYDGFMGFTVYDMVAAARYAQGSVIGLHSTADRVHVLSQHEGESPSVFAARIRSSVEELASGGKIVASVLVGGPDQGGRRLSSRSSVLRSLTSQMVRAGEGQLLLDGGPTRAGKLAMRALADMVAEQVHRTGVQVTSADLPTPSDRARRPLAA